MDITSHFISNDIISALGWSLVNTTWQGFIIALLVWAFLKSFRNTSSSLKYLVALLSLLSIVALSIFNFVNNFEHKDMLQEEASIVTINSENISDVLSEIVNNTRKTKTENEAFIKINNIVENYLPIFVNIWILGVVFFLLKFLGGYFYLQNLKLNKCSAVQNSWIKKFLNIQNKLSVRKRIKYLESKAVKIPLMLGYLKPVIIIPAGMLTGIPENQIEAIIAHELAHIKRNDFLVNILQTLIETVFFFHPGVWYISSVIRTERENCCDDIAITTCEGSLTYAKALLSVQELNPQKPYSAVAFSGQKNQMVNRIKRMLMKTEIKSNISDRIIATLIVFAGIIIATLSTSLKANSIENTNVYIDGIIPNSELYSALNPVQKSKTIFDKATPTDTVKNKWNDEHIKIDSKKIIRNFIDKDGQKREMKFSLKEGKVKELFVDGKAIPESDYKKYQPIIDETISDLQKAKVDIRKAMKEIQAIDKEGIKRDIEIAMKNMHINMDSINREISKSIKEIKIVNIDSIITDVRLSLENVERINLDSIMIDVQQSIKHAQHLNMEDIKRQMEEARSHIQNIDFDRIRSEIDNSWLDANMESIKKEMERVHLEIANIDWNNIRMNLDKNFDTFDKESVMKDMETELKKLEGLELEKK